MRTPDMRFGPDEALLRATKVVEDCRANGSPRPVVRAFFDEPSFTVSYVVHDPETRAAAIIDSVLDFDVASGRTAYGSAQAMIAYVKAEGLKIEWLIETQDRKSVVSGKSVSVRVDLGGRRIVKTKNDTEIKQHER